ncbi:MAG: hypothetical protein ABIP77_10525 [Candidatus Limnocylindrales bacterium]
MTVRHFAWCLAIAVVLVAGCATAAPSTSFTTTGAPTTVSLPPTATPTAAPQATTRPTATPLPSILPGEPWIAFQTATAAGYGIHLIRPDGTGLHRWPSGIAGTQEHPDWSHDGERILLNAVDGEGIHDLWIANADGTDPTRIVDCVAPCLWANEPAWSPDDQTVAFHRAVLVDGALRSTLEVLDVATGNVRVVLTMPTKQVVLAPRWAPDGTRLAVEVVRLPEATAEAEPDGGAIGIVDLDDAKPKVTFLMGFETFGNNPDWSPTDDVIVFSQPSGPERQFADLIVIRPDGSGRRNVTDMAKDGAAAIHPAFTADGQRLLFILTRAGKQESVMAVVGVDGSNLSPIGGSDYRDGFHPRLRPTP